MHFSLSASLLGTVALMITSVKAQITKVPPPLTTDSVNVTYHNDGSGVIASEMAPFNACFASENAFGKYSFINLSPANATINFYSDSNCQDFTFGLDGYYGGYPGVARSYRWVGWNMENRGELFNKAPIQGDGDGTPPPTAGGVTPHPEEPAKSESGTGSQSSTSTFFGGVFGSLVILSIGGVIFWKTAGKKMAQDKGKGVLPYNRVGGRRDDDDILLTTNNRSHNSFELGDEDDEDEDDRRHQSGRQQRYRDDDV
ncbi:hypothetical protein BGZ94_002700 [Podila epigama]|nr:hypothetical protein BGZ94_002700 [Podila epigama]